MQPNNALTLVVDSAHNGPPGSGNGGWTSGLIAAYIDGVAEVTLRQPPPLETELSVARTDEGITVSDPAGLLIATATSRLADIPPVEPVGRYEALAASARYPGHGSHHFPTCFVCGPKRADGLRVFPGPLPDGRTAALFEAPNTVDEVTVWAALDCPGGWTVIEPGQPWVLGRLAVALDELPEPGEECVITGQAVTRQGRKALVRTTLYASGGNPLARAEATWIALAG